jgi:deoxyribodipyrimidine photolyase-related protein
VPTSAWILGDQLLDDHPALATADQIVIVESRERLAQRPYHRRKLALLLAAMRQYAAALRAQGYSVDVRVASDFVTGLREHLQAHGSTRLVCMAATEWDTRALQHDLSARLGVPVEVLPNDQFLVERFPPSKAPALMEPFYRELRRRTGLLLDERGEPEGGRWNFDAENRKRYDGRPVPPPPSFAPDAVTKQAMADAQALPGIGSAEGFDLPVTRAQALLALDDFVARRLPNFGPFEDAMSSRDGLLFHSLLSPALNIGLLRPLELCQAAVRAFYAGHAPLSSVEGFVRQIIGWREYMYYRYWQLMPTLRDVNAWEATRPLPAFYWSGDTRMRCMQHAITRVLSNGHSHHIERLMLLCNWALLAGIRPQEVGDWFLECYIDAYEWVVLPNVLGMGLNADGGKVATKPYIASASYINKMSDYCGGCAYNHKARVGDDACPFNTLYWNFLLQHEARLRANPRLGPAVLGLARLGADERAAIQARAAQLLADLDHL